MRLWCKTAQKEDRKMKEQKTTRFLEVQLTPNEIRERKIDLGTLDVELTGCEQKMDTAKRSIKALQEQRRVMSGIVESGFERRSVDCTVRQSGTRVQTYRDDTHEVIEDRPVTADERQEELPLDEDENFPFVEDRDEEPANDVIEKAKEEPPKPSRGKPRGKLPASKLPNGKRS